MDLRQDFLLGPGESRSIYRNTSLWTASPDGPEVEPRQLDEYKDLDSFPLQNL
jgi:hypothetical protein